MSMRDNLKRTKGGTAYLEILDAVLAEETFEKEVAGILSDRSLGKSDPGLFADATAALAQHSGPPAARKASAAAKEEARLRVAESIHQVRIHPDVHDLYAEPSGPGKAS